MMAPRRSLLTVMGLFWWGLSVGRGTGRLRSTLRVRSLVEYGLLMTNRYLETENYNTYRQKGETFLIIMCVAIL